MNLFSFNTQVSAYLVAKKGQSIVVAKSLQVIYPTRALNKPPLKLRYQAITHINRRANQ